MLEAIITGYTTTESQYMVPFSTLQCSAFEKFHELYIEFRPTSNEELPAPVRTATGYINPDFALPINVVADKLPQLKVRTYISAVLLDKKELHVYLWLNLYGPKNSAFHNMPT